MPLIILMPKQKVISQNIANSDTPNYKAKEVDKTQYFKAERESSIESYRTDERHFTFKPEKRAK
ncbi:flagellar basal body protein [Peribacillus sp. AS_2]|nr:flagellar basal body protein [Peribacillus sp. AS_2]